MSGVCSVHPSVNSLYELLLHEVREISNYLVKLNEFKIQNKSAMEFCIDVLSIFMINTSFNQAKYLDLIKKLSSLKLEIKEKYIAYCRENRLPCEILNSNFELREKLTVNELINISQEYISTKINTCDRAKLGLFEVITIFARLCAINISKIKKLDKNYTEFDFELIRFFALTSASSIKNEKIKRRIVEFSSTAFKIKQKLYNLYEEKYGTKTNTRIKTSNIKGHCVLVSGDDPDELYDLLKNIEAANPKEEINVYTNGALFLAHTYPYFKNNKLLKGHFGSDSAEYDFSIFPGAILITRNFVQKIDSLYRGELFSNNLISFDKVFSIENGDYSPVVESSLKLTGFSKNEDDKYVEINYEKEEILNSVDKIIDSKAVIIMGGGNETKEEQYNNSSIININFSYGIDFIVELIEKLNSRNIETTVFFAQCNLMSLEGVLMLLDKKINLIIADCPRSFINPHILDSLKEEFKVQVIN